MAASVRGKVLHNCYFSVVKTKMLKFDFTFGVKGNLRSKKKSSSNEIKEREKWKKKRAITDLNVPNGSRDIPFQSQEFEQYGRRHFVDF